MSTQHVLDHLSVQILDQMTSLTLRE